MQFEHFVRLPAGQETSAVGEVADGRRPRSGEPGQGMLVCILVDDADRIDDGQYLTAILVGLGCQLIPMNSFSSS